MTERAEDEQDEKTKDKPLKINPRRRPDEVSNPDEPDLDSLSPARWMPDAGW